MRCADWATSEGVELTGTAPTASGVLLLEWPTPWPRDATAIIELAPVVTAAELARVRVQLVRQAEIGEERTVALYRRAPGGPIEPFHHLEATVPAGAVVPTALDLLNEPIAAGLTTSGVVDVLVCAHGARDACCGSRGTRVAEETRLILGRETFRVWRTSHLGGHRFAPTALVLPEGTVWGRLDAEALASIARRDLPPTTAAVHLRGSIAMSAPLQLLDRAAFEAVGWDWFDRARHGDVDGEAVTLRGRGPSSVEDDWSGRVTTRRLLTVPGCGRHQSSSDKIERELTLTSAIHTSLPARSQPPLGTLPAHDVDGRQ
jgi:hypothetical protein